MFLQGILHQRGAFAQLMNVREANVHVWLLLDDGDSFVLRNFRTIGPFADSEWGMIVGPDIGEAIVLRESSVVRAKFQLAAEGPDTIGFAAESSGGRGSGTEGQEPNPVARPVV